MATVEPLRPASLIPVPCRCGRLLRAKHEMVGAEIQCWDCRRMVVVPYPFQPGQALRAISLGWEVFIRVETLASILAATGLIVGLMCIPRHGLAAAGIALAAVAMLLVGGAYHRTLEDGQPIEPLGKRRSVFTAIVHAALASLMAAGTVIPFWVLNSGLHRSPRWEATGFALFAAAWLAFPVASLMAIGRDHRGRLGVREGLRVIARHPWVAIMALAIVPLAAACAEAVLLLTTLWHGSFAFLALDLFPIPGDPVILDGVPLYNSVDFRSYPTSRYILSYWDSLKHGYSFVGALPASLSRPTTNELNSYCIMLPPAYYLAFRGLISAVVVVMILAAATLQAAWMGALAAVDHRRVAP